MKPLEELKKRPVLWKSLLTATLAGCLGEMGPTVAPMLGEYSSVILAGAGVAGGAATATITGVLGNAASKALDKDLHFTITRVKAEAFADALTEFAEGRNDSAGFLEIAAATREVAAKSPTAYAEFSQAAFPDEMAMHYYIVASGGAKDAPEVADDAPEVLAADWSKVALFLCKKPILSGSAHVTQVSPERETDALEKLAAFLEARLPGYIFAAFGKEEVQNSAAQHQMTLAMLAAILAAVNERPTTFPTPPNFDYEAVKTAVEAGIATTYGKLVADYDALTAETKVEIAELTTAIQLISPPLFDRLKTIDARLTNLVEQVTELRAELLRQGETTETVAGVVQNVLDEVKTLVGASGDVVTALSKLVGMASAFDDKVVALHESVGNVDEKVEKVIHLLVTPRVQEALDPVFGTLPAQEAFTGRGDELKKIGERLTVSGAAGVTQAIAGLGGIGKTALAVEYAYASRKRYPFIFYINASGPDSLITDFKKVALQTGVTLTPHATGDEIKMRVKERLNGLTDYLLILDNADFDATYTPDVLKTYLPQMRNGHILITSRDEDRLHQLGVDEDDVIALIELRKEDAVHLLWTQGGGKGAPSAEENVTLLALAATLHHFPLALKQAASYIRENRKMTFAAYLTAYGAEETPLPDVKGVADEDGATEQKYRKAVQTTWHFNLEALQREGEGASVALFTLSAFLAPENIPLEVTQYAATGLVPGMEAVYDGAETDTKIKERFRTLLEPLRRYSLVTVDNAAFTYSVHRLVQGVVRSPLTPAERREWLDRAVNILNAAFPDPDFINWSLCARLTPHVQALQPRLASLKIATELVALLYNQAGFYFYSQNRLAEALPLFKEALEIRHEVLPEKHLGIAYSLNNLANLYREQNRLDDALPLLEETLTIVREVLPAKHSDIASSLNSLAYLYQAQNRIAEALPLYEEALAIRREVLPAKHPDIANSLNNLAYLYESQGLYDKALPLFEEALAIHQEVLPERHPLIAGSLNSLASLYRAQNRLNDALPLYEEALAIRREVLPAKHPDIAGSLNNLAYLYQVQNRIAEALPLFEEALAIVREVLPAKHPNIALSLNNLAYLYQKQNRLAEALPLYEEALAIRREVLPAKHPDIAISLNNLAGLYESQNRLAEALPLYEEALQILEESLPVGHPNRIVGRGNVMRFRLNKAMHDTGISSLDELMQVVLSDNNRPVEWKKSLIEAHQWLMSQQQENAGG